MLVSENQIEGHCRTVYGMSDDELKNDGGIVVEAMETVPRALRYASAALQRNSRNDTCGHTTTLTHTNTT